MKSMFKILIIFLFSFVLTENINDNFIYSDGLLLRGKIYYQIKDYKPYTGKVVEVNQDINGNKYVKKEFHLLNGVYHGQYIEWMYHNVIRKGNYVDGLKDGLWIEYKELTGGTKEVKYDYGIKIK